MAKDDADASYQAKLLETLSPLLSALVDSVKAEQTPEMIRLREIYMRRLVFSGDVIPSRLPAPKNITEVGGYINLLRELRHPEMALAAVASSIGMSAPLSAEDKKLMDPDPEGAIQKSLTSATGWVAACNACSPFWRGTIDVTYGAAQKQCSQHDQVKHGGVSTAAVLSL